MNGNTNDEQLVEETPHDYNEIHKSFKKINLHGDQTIQTKPLTPSQEL